MKTRYALPILLSGVLLSSPLTLVRANEDQPGMENKEHGWEPGKMDKELGLTAEQKAKMKSIRDSQMTALKPLRETQRTLMTKLQDQVKKKAPDAEIQATLTEIRSNRQAMADQMKQFHEQKEAVLTPTQQAQMALKMHEHMGEKHEHMHDRMMKNESR
jgi:Spy/CpxP family protein refolding chaperone